jgi:hypothetical protein
MCKRRRRANRRLRDAQCDWSGREVTMLAGWLGKKGSVMAKGLRIGGAGGLRRAAVAWVKCPKMELDRTCFWASQCHGTDHGSNLASGREQDRTGQDGTGQESE